MKARIPLAVAAVLAVAACDNRAGPPPPPIKLHILKVAPLAIPVADRRSALRDAYRLRPDRRFMLALGEVRRLAARTPAPPGGAAEAGFSAGTWTIRIADTDVGTLPELPDFPDYLALLVGYAKSSGPARGAASGKSPRDTGSRFLMPGILGDLRSAEASPGGVSFPDAARSFARIAFQMEDRLELAPLVPSRAMALLAIARAHDVHAAVEEEVLLAHALGYTRHAEDLARTLPQGTPLRLFEASDDAALWALASKPGASEEARYLALRRTIAEGDVARWKEARSHFFPNDSSLAMVSTGLELPLSGLTEVQETKTILMNAVPRAVLREISAGSAFPEEDPGSFFETVLVTAAGAARGLLWDGSALTEYYEAAFCSALDPEYRPGLVTPPLPKKLFDLLGEGGGGVKTPPEDGRGVPLLIYRMRPRVEALYLSDPGIAQEIRGVVRRLDARPEHRVRLAYLSHYYLTDLRAAEDLHRSLLRVLGDGNRTRKAESALYVGDWTILEKLLASRDLKPPEAAPILWSWFASYTEPQRLDRQFRRLMGRYPNHWDLTNYYVDFLRYRHEFGRACEVVEQWIQRNPDSRTPGFLHARMRLAHGYVLAHQHEKGRILLEGLNVSDYYANAFRRRILAECLAGLNRLPEAEAMVRRSLAEVPSDYEAVRRLVEILWTEGKDREAAETLATLTQYSDVKPAYICETLSHDFPAVMVAQQFEHLKSAVDELAKQASLVRHYACAASGFADAGRWEEATLVASKLHPPDYDSIDQRLVRYENLKKWKGRGPAAEWLKKEMVGDQTGALSAKAHYSKNDDVLWDVVVPNAVEKPEEVWLLRACGFVLRGGGGDSASRRAALLDYYGKENPARKHLDGRYIMGLASEASLVATVDTERRMSEVAYFLGVKAQGERRFRDACEWYRVSVETQEESDARSFAGWALSNWAQTVQGLWKLEAGETAATEPAIQPSASAP